METSLEAALNKPFQKYGMTGNKLLLCVVLAVLSKSLPIIQAYLFSDPDYIGYAHPNANIDNAYWWRDESGHATIGAA